MKKFNFNIIYKLSVVIAFIAMAVSTTSCTQSEADEVIDKMGKAIGDGYDFNEAVNCIVDNSDWNSRVGCYEKHQGCPEDANKTLYRYTNYKMSIPGEWHLQNGNYIIVRRSNNPKNIYDIEIKTTDYDYNNRPCGKKYIKAYFMYD